MPGEGIPAWQGGVTALNVDQRLLHLCHFCGGVARGEGTQARDTVPGLRLLLTGFGFCSKARDEKLGSTFKSEAVPKESPRVTPPHRCRAALALGCDRNGIPDSAPGEADNGENLKPGRIKPVAAQ